MGLKWKLTTISNECGRRVHLLQNGNYATYCGSESRTVVWHPSVLPQSVLCCWWRDVRCTLDARAGSINVQYGSGLAKTTARVELEHRFGTGSNVMLIQRGVNRKRIQYTITGSLQHITEPFDYLQLLVKVLCGAKICLPDHCTFTIHLECSLEHSAWSSPMRRNTLRLPASIFLQSLDSSNLSRDLVSIVDTDDTTSDDYVAS